MLDFLGGRKFFLFPDLLAPKCQVMYGCRFLGTFHPQKSLFQSGNVYGMKNELDLKGAAPK